MAVLISTSYRHERRLLPVAEFSGMDILTDRPLLNLLAIVGAITGIVVLLALLYFVKYRG